jgi:hypothetical protein
MGKGGNKEKMYKITDTKRPDDLKTREKQGKNMY